MSRVELLLCLIAICLASASLTTLPTVDSVLLDDVRLYTSFYTMSLSPLYYIATAYLCLLALFAHSNTVKISSLVLLAMLVETTPVVMFKNPIMQDAYPYLSEVVWLVKHGYVASVNNLSETPGLGLTFSQLMLVTGLNHFEIYKLFPVIMVLAITLTALTSYQICKNYSLLPMIFLGYLWYQPNVLHRSSHFVLLAIILVYLLINLRRSPGFVIAYVITVAATVITYPGIIAVILALLSSAVLLLLLKKRSLLSLGIATLSLTVFLVWAIWISRTDFAYMARNIYYGLQEFAMPTEAELLRTGYGIEGALTDSFRMVTYLRITEMLFLIIPSMIIAARAIIYWYREAKFERHLIPSFLYVNLIVILISFAATHYYKWEALKFESTIVYLAALSLTPLLAHAFNRVSKFKFIVTCTILVPLLLIPLTNFSALPITHAPSSELAAKGFIVKYGKPELTVHVTEYSMPWALDEVLLDMNEAPRFSLTGSPKDYGSRLNYLTVQRYLARDGYLRPPLMHKEFLSNLMASASQTCNLVYCANNFTNLFLITP